MADPKRAKKKRKRDVETSEDKDNEEPVEGLNYEELFKATGASEHYFTNITH